MNLSSEGREKEVTVFGRKFDWHFFFPFLFFYLDLEFFRTIKSHLDRSMFRASGSFHPIRLETDILIGPVKFETLWRNFLWFFLPKFKPMIIISLKMWTHLILFKSEKNRKKFRWEFLIFIRVSVTVSSYSLNSSSVSLIV